MERVNSLAALGPQLDAFAHRIRHETGLPGIAIAVSHRGECIEAFAGTRHVDDSTPLDAAARYHLGCATKLLLAVVSLELAARGELDLDAPLGDFLPELRTTVHGQTVRVAHLLAHTSGYRGTHILDASTRPDDWDSLVAYLAVAPQLFAPGTVFSYEHTESVLLGEIVQRLTGEHPLALVATEVLAPLRITPERFAARLPSDAGRHHYDERVGRFVPLESTAAPTPLWLPAFSDYTLTLAELARIGELVTSGRSDGTRLLAPATLARLHSSVVRLPTTAGGPLRELLPVAFGYGTAELRDGFRGNTGISGGQCLGLRFDAARGLSIAVALNATAPQLRDLILAAVSHDLGGRREPPTSPAPPEALETFAGTYLGPGGAVVVAHYAGDRLVCELGRAHRTERLRVELMLDAGELVLRTPVPQLSLGFFVEPTTEAVGLMVGLSAYRRMSSAAA